MHCHAGHDSILSKSYSSTQKTKMAFHAFDVSASSDPISNILRKFSGSVKWLQILVDVFSVVVTALLRGQKFCVFLVVEGKELKKILTHKNGVCKKTKHNNLDTHMVRASCKALCEIKTQGILFKKQEKSTTRYTKICDFSFYWQSRSLFVPIAI